MNKRKFAYILSGLIIVLISTFIYLSYFSHPSSFLSENQLIEEINKTFPDANVNRIQGIFNVNEKNKYVPFISSNDSYGKSFWVWDKYKWRVAYIDTTGEPHIWKVNKRDPSSYHFVWNIHPDDQLKHLNLYMIRDRGYSYTQVTKEMYHPRVQMQQTVSVEEETYGVLKIPEEWATFVRSIKDTQLAKQSNLDVFFSQFSWEQHVYYGWIPFDQENKETFPSKSVNGSGYSNGKIEIDYLMILDEWEVER